MSNERYMKQGLRADLQKELKVLRNRAENIVKAMRDVMFVVTSELDLDTENIVVGANDLHAVVEEAASIRERIATLEDELGL